MSTGKAPVEGLTAVAATMLSIETASRLDTSLILQKTEEGGKTEGEELPAAVIKQKQKRKRYRKKTSNQMKVINSSPESMHSIAADFVPSKTACPTNNVGEKKVVDGCIDFGDLDGKRILNDTHEDITVTCETSCRQATALFEDAAQKKTLRTMPRNKFSVQNSPLPQEIITSKVSTTHFSQQPSMTKAVPSSLSVKKPNSKVKVESRPNSEINHLARVSSGRQFEAVPCSEPSQHRQRQRNSTNIKHQYSASPKAGKAPIVEIQNNCVLQPGRRNGNASQRQGDANKKSSYGLNRITKLEKVFEEYWSAEDVQHGLKRGQLIQGTLRINPRNYEECYISHPDGKSDVCISGMHDRNRALNGDIVCVHINTKEDWKVLIEDLNEREEHLVEAFRTVLSLECSSPVVAESANGLCTPSLTKPCVRKGANGCSNSGSKTQNSNQKQNQPLNRYTFLKDIGKDRSERSVQISPVIKNLFSNGNNSYQSSADGLHQMERNMDFLPEDLVIRTGKVVYIVEKVHSRACVGRIKPITDKNYPNMAFFSPNDSRLPRILVSSSDCPEEFKCRPEDFENTIFIARITDWERNMPFARGCLARSLGEAGEIEPETEGMLVEYELDFGEFSEDVLSCLPQAFPWTIPEEEFSYRRDLRRECIFTIDPATARDLDDALSCRQLEPGIFEVGVHIADVSFFVEPDTSLDKEAARRCTSVYLVQKVIPMLPRLLCEELCSLNAGQDRLCFSVIWKMNEQGEILDEWFGRTVINSCSKLCYDHAQGFITEPDRDWTAEELPQIYGGYSIVQIRDVVLNLNKIAMNMRKKRFDGGALRLDQVKLSFTLSKETGLPSGWYIYEQRDSNRLVEEFMLLANMAVAHKIKSAFPKCAVLRRHPPPQSKLLENVVSLCQNLGITLDASSAGALQRSLYQETGSDEESRAWLQVLVSLCSKPMQNARYFCTGTLDNEDDYSHYALNVPLYTHFTSPIRRYPDIMVHRLLATTLGYTEHFISNTESVEKQCVLCNSRKTSAKRVSDMSSELFFGVFLKQCGPLEEKGMVMNVLDKSFDVLILSLGIVKRAYCEKLPLASFEFSKVGKRPQLELVWKVDERHPTKIHQELTLFTVVSCQLVPSNEVLKWNLEVKHPLDLYL